MKTGHSTAILVNGLGVKIQLVRGGRKSLMEILKMYLEDVKSRSMENNGDWLKKKLSALCTKDKMKMRLMIEKAGLDTSWKVVNKIKKQS